MPSDHPEYLDRYRILSVLGRGSMGDVYLAVDPKFDRKIALKVMSAHRLGLEDELEDLRRRFVHEALAAGRLNHPDIVTIHDADTDRATGWPFIAMEWVEGESLRVRLRRDGPLELRSALAMTAGVARALDYAHRQGVGHRDIKPANLLLRADDDRPKIADFGVAKLVSSSLTLTGQVLGSPNYMSPEQVKAEAIDGRTDLFALGVVLYETLAGRPAFAADSLASITFKIVNVDPRPVGMYNSLVPEAVQHLLDRALAKNPEERFPSGAEMADALDDVAAALGDRSTQKRQATKELTLPAGIPEAPPAEARTRAGETQPVGAAPKADPTEKPKPRRSSRALAAVALVAVLLGFVAAKLWLEAPNNPDLETLTRNLGIFERALGDSTEAGDADPETPTPTEPMAESEEGYRTLSIELEGPPPDELDETLTPSTDGESPAITAEQPVDDAASPDTPAPRVETFEMGSDGSPGNVPPTLNPEQAPTSEGTQTAEDTQVAEHLRGPADDETTRAVAPPPAETAPPPPPAPPPKARAVPKPKPARLTVALEKRFKLAYISVWVDGKKVRTRRLEGGSWVRRIAGQSYEFELPVPAGERKIQVHISGLSTRLEAQGKIIEDFEPGSSKVLWVDVRRHPDKLELTWKD